MSSHFQPSAMGRSFVFIESNTTGTGALCVPRARARGFRVLFLTADPSRYRFLSNELIVPHVIDTTDVEAVCGLLHEVGDIAGVMSTSEYFVETAARVAARLSLVTPDADAVRTCRHKGHLARALERAGVNVPATTEVTSLGELEQVASTLRYPAVLKPVSGSGSVGVRLVSNAAELLAGGGQLLSQQHFGPGVPDGAGILVQPYVSGDEYSVEVFSVNGRHHVVGCTRKYLGKPPSFIETGHDFPARLSPAVEEALRGEAVRALCAAGYHSGPSHIECRVQSEGRPTIIEVNPRLAGGMIPRAIEMATGVDLIGALVDFFAGQPVDLTPVDDRCAAIRFLVAEREGTIEAFQFPVETAAASGGVEVCFFPIKSIGEYVEPQGDFRDRLACIILASREHTQLHHALGALMEGTAVQVRDARESPAAAGTGRIRTLLRPEALDILITAPSPAERIAQLDRVTAIDEAHLSMLVEAGILAAREVAPLLVEIAALRADRYSEIADRRAPRGVYALYEQFLIARLGERVGGVAHLARSRNDINACLFKLDARDWLTTTFASLWRLRDALLAKAAATMDVALPVYSQFQPGQPGTLAYFLWSVDAALRRDQQALLHLFEDLQVCPMGAGTGAGTDFPIRPEVTAELLGFSSGQRSALDAVASRDLGVRLLGAWAVCSTTLSRFAHDLQIWTMGDIGFFELPDDLSGGSSIMPQKKNPYLLEIAKGKLVWLPSALDFALHAMQKTPFSNSIEVGTEAVSVCAQAAARFSDSCDLLRLMAEALTPREGKGQEAARKGTVVATQVVNALVRERSMSFHEAHRCVAAHIADAIGDGREPLESLRNLTAYPLDDVAVASEALQYGGGAGTVARQLSEARAQLRRDSDDWQRYSLPWIEGERRRRSAISTVIAAASQ